MQPSDALQGHIFFKLYHLVNTNQNIHVMKNRRVFKVLVIPKKKKHQLPLLGFIESVGL
jgi:hypothetical protein